MRGAPHCGHIGVDGRRCGAYPIGGGELCINHSRSGYAAESRRRGWEKSVAVRREARLDAEGALFQVPKLRRVVGQMIRALSRDELDGGRARALIASMDLMLRLNAAEEPGREEAGPIAPPPVEDDSFDFLAERKGWYQLVVLRTRWELNALRGLLAEMCGLDAKAAAKLTEQIASNRQPEILNGMDFRQAKDAQQWLQWYGAASYLSDTRFIDYRGQGARVSEYEGGMSEEEIDARTASEAAELAAAVALGAGLVRLAKRGAK